MSIQAALRERTIQADEASGSFDFKREGSLATFWRQATPGTTYWRGYVPMLHLPDQMCKMEDSSLAMEDGQLILNGHEGTALWQFLGDDGRSRIALQLQRQGIRTVMEVDDNYLRFAPPLYGKYGSWTRTHREAMENGTGYSVEMHRKVVPMMDAIVCATEALAEEYAEYNDSVYVCPNSIMPEDWEVERVESDILRIGYYGSPSHVRDYPRVKKALKWAARQRDVQVVFIGFQPPGWSGDVVAWEDDVIKGRQNLGAIDVGIAPLTRNVWADGKSDVKALEYAMAGVMPIVEDAPPYSPWKRSGWGYVPSTEAEWEEVIRHVVAHRDIVPAEAAKAKAYVLAERTIEKNIHAWREAVSG